MNKILENLNPEQIEAVTHFGSPLMIVAGAGSGKTTVLTRKIAYLIQEMGIPAHHILGITFTNKAAKEMRERVARGLHNSTTQPYLSTFHAFCADTLRREYRNQNRPEFVICDQGDQTQMIKRILKRHNLAETVYNPSAVLYRIQGFKNQVLTLDQVAQLTQDAKLTDLYTAYQKELKQNNLLDFNDLINETYTMLKNDLALRDRYQDHYSFILIDEYQDTNQSQYLLVKLLAEKYQNLSVVGDFDQNIYSWRGANIENMLRFEQDYPSCRTIMLEQNYRSTQTILHAANHLIAHNQNRKEKKLWTENPKGNPIDYTQAADERIEANLITHKIKTLWKSGTALKDIAILYRTNAQSRVIEESLLANQIPYRIVGGLKFFSRADIKDLVSYLRLIHNPQDLLSLRRIINVPARGIGDVSIQKLIDHSITHQDTIESLCCQNNSPLSGKIRDAAFHFFSTISELREIYTTSTTDRIAILIECILEKTGYLAYIESDPFKSQDRKEIISELLTFAREEELELGDFLSKIALLTDLDDEKEEPEMVTLMTMHLAKGLEFETVFIPGIEEGILPHFKSQLDAEALEEERRLFYVALTRAKKEAYLFSSQQRLIFGELWRNEPSRFLNELPPETLQNQAPTPTQKVSQSSGIPSLNIQAKKAEDIPSYIMGERVMHSQWGEGRIQKVEGLGDKTLLVVSFSVGTKKLLAKYAPLQKVS